MVVTEPMPTASAGQGAGAQVASSTSPHRCFRSEEPSARVAVEAPARARGIPSDSVASPELVDSGGFAFRLCLRIAPLPGGSSLRSSQHVLQRRPAGCLDVFMLTCFRTERIKLGNWASVGLCSVAVNGESLHVRECVSMYADVPDIECEVLSWPQPRSVSGRCGW